MHVSIHMSLVFFFTFFKSFQILGFEVMFKVSIRLGLVRFTVGVRF